MIVTGLPVPQAGPFVPIGLEPPLPMLPLPPLPSPPVALPPFETLPAVAPEPPTDVLPA
jgi:hypothetical protein